MSTAPKLEFEPCEWSADGYFVIQMRRGPFIARHYTPERDMWFDLDNSPFATFEAAKAACQSHADSLRADKMIEMTRLI